VAGKLNPRNSEVARQKIQTTVILKRLQDHHLGKLELSDTQISVGQFLISYSLPKPAQTVENVGTVTVKWQ